MKAVTAKQIQKLDRIAIKECGIPSIVFMENAGRGASSEIARQIKRVKSPLVCVFCGSGNNGGDGFVIARHLLEAGIKLKIFAIGKTSKLSTDAGVNYKILKRLKYSVQWVKPKDLIRIKRHIKNADIIVDAIFGVGLSRDIKGIYKDIIELINECAKKVIAVDVPSGLDATTGNVLGVCIKANMTLTFTYAKTGLVRKNGPEHCGPVKIIDIGIPNRIKRKRL